jgi:ketosteroid isomerase-like protein
MREQVQALVTGWAAAFNAGRTDDLAGLYAPEARLVPPGRPVIAQAQALRGFFADIRAQGFRDYRVEVSDTLARDGVLIASGRWSLAGPGPDGADHRYDGNWLMLLDAAATRILAHMWN